MPSSHRRRDPPPPSQRPLPAQLWNAMRSWYFCSASARLMRPWKVLSSAHLPWMSLSLKFSARASLPSSDSCKQGDKRIIEGEGAKGRGRGGRLVGEERSPRDTNQRGGRQRGDVRAGRGAAVDEGGGERLPNHTDVPRRQCGGAPRRNRRDAHRLRRLRERIEPRHFRGI